MFKLLSVNVCEHLKQIAEMHLDDLIAPIEYEVDVLYPGSPEDINAVGGDVETLLQAYARDAAFAIGLPPLKLDALWGSFSARRQE